jgi:hypothetical protein
MRKALVAVITASLLVSVARVDATTEHGHNAHRGPPAAGGEALYRWCRTKVIVTYGQHAPIPGEPHRMILPRQNTVGMADACVRSHGEVY